MREYDNFIQSGVRVENRKDGRCLSSLNEFVDELREIQIPSHQRKEKDSLVSQQKLTKLRGLEVSTDRATTQRCYKTSTFQNRTRHNSGHDRSQSTPSAGQKSGQIVRIFSFTTEGAMSFQWMGRCSTAKQNRWKKHQRPLFTCSSVRALQGEESLMSVISWRSSRIDWVCRSATCAETRATVDLEDELFALR